MTKRLYYTCPIQALYMMKEFGVTFESFDFYALINQIDRNKSIKCQYCVAEESLPIFARRPLDFVITDFLTTGRKDEIILRRDQKAFFQPLEE